MPKAKPQTGQTGEQSQPAGSNSADLAPSQLKGFFAELDRLEDLKRDIGEDLSELWKAIKSKGFDTAALKAVRKRQKMSAEDRQELEAQIDLYEGVLGLTTDTSEPEDKGVKAASEGQPVTANPYTKKSPNHERWNRAWVLQTALMANPETAESSATSCPKEKENGTTEQPEEAEKAA